jgi:hypothetical protein
VADKVNKIVIQPLPWPQSPNLGCKNLVPFSNLRFELHVHFVLLQLVHPALADVEQKIEVVKVTLWTFFEGLATPKQQIHAQAQLAILLLD